MSILAKLRALPTLATPATFATDNTGDTGHYVLATPATFATDEAAAPKESQESQLSQHHRAHETGRQPVTVAKVATVAETGGEKARAANDPPTVAKVATVAAPPSCRACTHRTAAGTCDSPAEAGLAKTFGIRWPDPSHAARCPAYSPPPAEPEAWRTYLASPASDAELATMARRVTRFEHMLGIPADLADRTADRLLARDREGGTRTLCCECAACRYDQAAEGWRCSSRLGPPGALPRDLVVLQLQRCPGFSVSQTLLTPMEDEHAHR